MYTYTIDIPLIPQIYLSTANVIFLIPHIYLQSLHTLPQSAIRLKTHRGLLRLISEGEAIFELANPSCEPLVSFCEIQKIPAKISKIGHNAIIWYLLHAGCFTMPRTIERHFPIKPGEPRGIGPFFIPFPNSLHKRCRAVSQLTKTEREISVGPV